MIVPPRPSIPGSRRHSGFTLLELLLVTVLLALVAVLGVASMSHSRSGADTRSVASTLAEEMRLARQRAIQKHQPVAVVLPSSEGTRPHAQSYYVVEGPSGARITKVVDFSREAPETVTFVGSWALDPAKLADPTRTTTRRPPSASANGDRLAMSTWGGSGSDFAFVFMPSGTVSTNGLPNFDNSYHVVVSQGVNYRTGPPLSADAPSGFVQCFADLGSVPNYVLTAVSQPYTINVSPLGTVTVTPGVTGALDAQMQVQSSAVPLPAPPAPTPTMPTSGSNNAPVIASVTIEPTPNPATLPAGVDAQVRRGGKLTLTVQANDLDKEPLTCAWTATKVGDASAAAGAFSVTGEQGMEGPQSDGEPWWAQVDWTPPAGAQDGDRYVLDLTLSDGEGGTATASRTVRVVTDRIAFNSGRNGGAMEIFAMNADGSEQARLTDNTTYRNRTGDAGPALSPDGTRIAFQSDRDGTWGVYVMNADGSQQTRVASGGGPAWSPDGRRIAFIGGSAGPYKWRLNVMNADGSGQTTLTTDSTDAVPAWSPDGSRIAFTSHRDGNYQVYAMNADGSGLANLTNNAANFGTFPSGWSSDGTRILYGEVQGNGIYVMNADGSNQTRVNAPTGAREGWCSWSPDGTRIALSSERDGALQIYLMHDDGSGLTRLNAAGYAPTWTRTITF